MVPTRRSSGLPPDNRDVGEGAEDAIDAAAMLLDLYDRALPQVYGYLLRRGGHQALAQDLTSAVFLAAVDAVRRDNPPVVNTPWLIGTARHKLVDHWRSQAGEERVLRSMATDPTALGRRVDDPWQAGLDALHVDSVLQQLGSHHRAALTFRYVDDLPVPEVAALLGRTLHATEALLVRSRQAFRQVYLAAGEDDDSA